MIIVNLYSLFFEYKIVDLRANFVVEGCREQLRSSQLNDCLKDLLKRELLPIEMRSNVLKLFKFLFDRNDFLTKNELEDHLELIKCLILSNENQFLKSHLDKLITSIEDTLV